MATMMAINPSPDLDQGHSMVVPKVYYKGEPLTEQQVGILNMVGQGKSNEEIARVLGISRRTVESHLAKIRTIISKLDGYRPRERDLVLFAKDMRDGYEVFNKISGRIAPEPTHIELIEDWDDEESFEPEQGEVDKKIIKIDRYRPRYEISDFSPEEKDIQFVDGKYFLF